MNYEPDRDFDIDERPVSASWLGSVTEDLERSNKRAWLVAGVAGAIALLLAIALVILLPLKSREPYTLLVDRQTGNVEALAPLEGQSVTPDESLTRSFLVQYVTARESFQIDNLQEDYRKVSLLSADEVRRDYARLMDSENYSSPLARLPRSAVLKVEVKSVSPLEKNKAMVRFVTTRRDNGGLATAPQHWVAVIGYTFTNAEMSEDDRFINPLGFQVTSYRRDAETLPNDTLPQDNAPSGPVISLPPEFSPSVPDGNEEQAAPVMIRPAPPEPAP